MPPEPDPSLFDKVVNLTKRRGFVFPSAEIYGGFRSTYDYGPIGVLLLRNVKDAWWRSMVQLRHDVVGLDAAILSPPRCGRPPGTWPTSPIRWSTAGSARSASAWTSSTTPTPARTAGRRGPFTEARAFNLMFKTTPGRSRAKGRRAYLRPETAQGIFTNFANVLTTSRKKPPFGIAQVGKSFRNEITPQNFVFRTREFEQMEMEYFVPPDEGDQWYEYWCKERFDWYVEHGIPEADLRLRPHDPDELSHYSTGTADVEYRFPWGFDELEGIANRTDYDLKQHAEHSGERLEYFDQASGERYVPHVIEPAAGATRTMMAFLLAAYDEEEVKGETRTVLRLHHRLAPFKVAVLPLSKKDDLQPLSQEVLGLLQPEFMCDYDVTQSIGRRYRRQDELGTPFAVTIDFDSLDDRAVTVRERDSMEQQRVGVDDLVDHLGDRLR